jgi:hypothetical protein
MINRRAMAVDYIHYFVLDEVNYGMFAHEEKR